MRIGLEFPLKLSGTLALAIALLVLAVPNTSFAQDPPSPVGPPVSAPDGPGLGDQRLSQDFPGAVDPNVYKIGAEDVLHISVWREPELSMAQTVRPDGKITMPLIGDVEADNVTPKALAAAITDKLKEFINNPNVTVTVSQVRSKKFTLTGEVNRPGAYPLLVPTTVLDALTNAGGFRDFANKKKITIVRGTERLKFNYNDVIEGKNLEQNIMIENGDLIIVP